MAEPSKSKETSGWLWKWSNRSRKYEKMWFVLSNGVLTHYTNQTELTESCRGAITVAGASIEFDDTCKFIVSQDDDVYHVRARGVRDKEYWVDALLKARGSDQQQSPIITDRSNKDLHRGSRPVSMLHSTNNAFCAPCHDARLGKRQVRFEEAPSPMNHPAPTDEAQEPDPVPRSRNDFPNQGNSPNREASPDKKDSLDMNRTFETVKKEPDSSEFDILINTMREKLEDLVVCNNLIYKFNVDLQRAVAEMGNGQEKEESQCMLHQAAGYQAIASEMTKACTNYLNLAESYRRKYSTLYHSEHEQRVKLEEVIKSLIQEQSKSWETISEEEEKDGNDDRSDNFESLEASYTSKEGRIDIKVYQVVAKTTGVLQRRTKVPDRPNVSDSLWSVLKNCIGNDLSKMPLPVSFAEPLSLLQRLTEDFEYGDVLDKASEVQDTATQLAYVAAFISSSYSTTIGRSGKPFNPLLGETYECDRTSDLGWRSIAEQVSHHPPVAAIHSEGKNWEFWMDQSMKSKFKGTTLTVIPLGECHVNFKNGNRYSWQKPNTSIHNIIVGKLWVEQEGEVNIKCATSHVTCKLTFIASGWTGENYSLKGVIKDAGGNPVYEIQGRYATQIEYRPAGSKDPGTVIWKRTEPPKDNSKYYHFTLLACQLNEMEDRIAPTDSRNRPDQRLMEEGDFEAANIMKKKLEEYQRGNKKETWKPSWFQKKADPDTNTEIWTYNGEYWPCKAKKDWSRCPSYIFTPP